MLQKSSQYDNTLKCYGTTYTDAHVSDRITTIHPECPSSQAVVCTEGQGNANLILIILYYRKRGLRTSVV